MPNQPPVVRRAAFTSIGKDRQACEANAHQLAAQFFGDGQVYQLTVELCEPHSYNDTVNGGREIVMWQMHCIAVINLPETHYEF